MRPNHAGDAHSIGHSASNLICDAEFRGSRPDAKAVSKRASRHAPAPVGGHPKRVFDVTVALAALLCLLPAFLFAAFLIWRGDRGRVLFGHPRIGWGGRMFRCLKFRSMVPNAGEVLANLLATDPAAAREWAETQKLRADPRITAVGQLLRVTSLDELPQLLNVLSGQMSIVGPRPIVADEVARYGADVASYRACRPGITGLWQVSGRSDCGYAERVALDVRYASTWSLWLDLKIVARTVLVVLARKGSR